MKQCCVVLMNPFVHWLLTSDFHDRYYDSMAFGMTGAACSAIRGITLSTSTSLMTR